MRTLQEFSSSVGGCRARASISAKDAGAELKHISRHMLGLFAGQPGARAWRRHPSEHAHLPGSGFEVLEAALGAMPRAA